MLKLIRHLFPKAYIAIDQNFDTIDVSYLVILEKKILKQDSHKFTRMKGKIPEQFFTFINPILLKYASCYIITFLNKQLQNTIIDINKLPHSKLEHIKHVDIKSKYSIYCNKYDMKDIFSELKGVDIDLLISPFAVLHYKYMQNKLDHTVVVLAKRNLLSISVFDKGVAILSSNVAVTVIENSTKEDSEEDSEEDSDDLDDIFGDNDFDVLDGDGDGDGDDDIDMDMDMDMDFNMDDLDGNSNEEEFPSNNQTIQTSDLDSLDINLNTIIKCTIEDFIKAYYEHGDYEFLSSIVIYDDNLIDSSCVRYLKDELMMDIVINKVKIIDILIEIAGTYE
jgi:hypothetical protein